MSRDNFCACIQSCMTRAYGSQILCTALTTDCAAPSSHYGNTQAFQHWHRNLYNPFPAGLTRNVCALDATPMLMQVKWEFSDVLVALSSLLRL